MEMADAALSGKSPLVLEKKNNLNPNLISRWKGGTLVAGSMAIAKVI